MAKRRNALEQLIEEEDLDLTPLIDCIFLLLIFFMVTTVFLDVKGLVIDLPGESDSQDEEQQQQRRDVNIYISTMGEYTVAGEMVPATQLAGAIQAAMEEANNKNVIIQGDEEAQHRYIVYAMDMAQGQGAEQMAFAIEQEEGAQ
ncbi:ExbD/TolR family protein [Candidatus Latescibacterota bacterium]